MKREKKEPYEDEEEKEHGKGCCLEIETDRGGESSEHSKMVKQHMKKMGHG